VKEKGVTKKKRKKKKKRKEKGKEGREGEGEFKGNHVVSGK
jgi:hypothetical protein